jgi:CheY-like chemotaxis protein
MEKERIRPDVMDVHMPEMGGLQSTMQICREEDATGRRVPIIATTAYGMSGNRKRCSVAGTADYNSKPVSHTAIEQAIATTFNPE